jgi:hypothetical protein
VQQAPDPLQRLQAEQVPWTGESWLGRLLQVPVLAPRLQALQGWLHRTLQQTPSEQIPDAQVAPPVHGCPLAFLQTPAVLQTKEESMQSLLAVQLVKHAELLAQRYGEHELVVALLQVVEVPAQKRGEVKVEPEQLGGTHCCVLGSGAQAPCPLQESETQPEIARLQLPFGSLPLVAGTQASPVSLITWQVGQVGIALQRRSFWARAQAPPEH